MLVLTEIRLSTRQALSGSVGSASVDGLWLMTDLDTSIIGNEELMTQCEHCGCEKQHITKKSYEDLAHNLSQSKVDFNQLVFDFDPRGDERITQVWFLQDETEENTPYYVQYKDGKWEVKEDL